VTAARSRRRDASWTLGQKVKFVRDYRLPAPPEYVDAPQVPAGTVGMVVRCFDNSIWVQVPGLSTPVTVWFEAAYPDADAKTDLLEPAD
jgi:hypothetical protein